MSEKYLIVSESEQVPSYDPKAMAEGLGMSLVGFLGPLLLELDKRLIRTLVQAIEAILTFRDRVNGLVLSELGSYLDPISKGGGTKRLSRLLDARRGQKAAGASEQELGAQSAPCLRSRLCQQSVVGCVAPLCRPLCAALAPRVSLAL